MITDGVLQGLILRLNQQSEWWNEVGWTFVKILDYTKVGMRQGIMAVEVASGDWEQGYQLEGHQQAVERDCQKPQEIQKKQM